ncbi:MAG: hypothetical protein HFE65_08630 [Clostridiales bacterium]|nr:hypothetical protein [Clostridiales bacterium]
MKQDRNWHHLTVEELSSVFKTDSVTGLTDREAARRLRRGTNKIWVVRSVSFKRYAGRSLADFSTVLLVITTLLAAVFGNGAETAAICVMLAAARCTRIITYVCAQHIFEKNAAASLPRARVVRAGTVKTIPADQVVPGDVIVLDAGDTVPCDVRLTAADHVLVSEGQLTENEGITAKNAQDIPAGQETPISLRTNMLYASSAVVSGFCMGMAVATGENTLVYAREGQIELSGGEKLPVLEKLSDLGRQCSLGLILIALVACIVGTVIGKLDLFTVFLPAIAAASACLNEYISAAGAMAWAAALYRKNKSEAVFRDAAAADKAADVEVLFLRSSDALKSEKVSFHAYYTGETYQTVSDAADDVPVRLLYLAHCATGTAPGGALYTGQAGAQPEQGGVLPYSVVRSLWEEQRLTPVAESDRFMVTEHIGAGQAESCGMDSALLARDGAFYFTCLGRTEALLSQCTTQRVNGETIPLTPEKREKILSLVSSLTGQGVTVAAVGFRSSHYNSLRRISVLQSNLCFEGFIAVSQRPQAETLADLRAFRRDGGRVVLFSDGSKEDRCFAQAQGILGKEDIYITRQESAAVRTLPLEPGKLTMVSIPGGMDGIRERVRYIRMSGDSGLCSGYLGWGVEDMWTMQQADIAFAAPVPGKYGADIPPVLRVTAHGITGAGSGGFRPMMDMIMRCRAAVRNIHNMLSYLVVSHMARVVLLLVCAAAGLPLLSASQMVFWGMVLDFSAAAAVALVPAGKSVSLLHRKKEETDAAENDVVNALPMHQKGILDREATGTLLLALYGTLLAVLAVISPYLGRTLIGFLGPSCNLTPIVQQSCMFLSCVCVIPFVAAEFGGGGLFRKNAVYGRFIWVPYLAAVLGIVWTFVSGGLTAGSDTAALDTAAPGWLLFIFALLPVLISAAALSVVRALLNRQKNRKCK